MIKERGSGGSEVPKPNASILLAAEGYGTGAPDALAAIADNTDPKLGYEVVLASSSNSPRLKELLRSIEGSIKVIDADPGTSKAELLNMAADAALSEYLVILDSEVTPTGGWLKALLDAGRGLGSSLGIAGCVLADSSSSVLEAGFLTHNGSLISVARLVESTHNAWLIGFRPIPAAGYFGCLLPSAIREELGWIDSTPLFSDAWTAYCRRVADSGLTVGIACDSVITTPAQHDLTYLEEISTDEIRSASAVDAVREIVASMHEAGQISSTGQLLDARHSTAGANGLKRRWDAYKAIDPLVKGKRVLDLNCHKGYGSHVIAAGSEFVLGMDPRPEFVLLADELWNRPNLRFELGGEADIEKIVDDYDRILMFGDAEQLPRLHGTLSNFSGKLTDDQIVIVAVLEDVHRGTPEIDEMGIQRLQAGFLKGFFRQVETLIGSSPGIRIHNCQSPRSVIAGLTSIVIPAYNRVDMTMGCLESIRANTNVDYEVIVVNNGSGDSTGEFLEQQSDLKVITNRRNQGFSTAVNQGMREASGDRLLILTNDTLVTPGWLERMIAHMDRSGFALVGPLSNYATRDQTVSDVPYAEHDREGLFAFATQIAEENRGQFLRSVSLSGLCLLINRAVIQRIGGFDPIFNPGNWEDTDICLRAVFSGFQVAVARDVFIHHYGGRGPGWAEAMQTNWTKFKEKWRVAARVASPSWDGEAGEVLRTLVQRQHDWPSCFDGSIWERPVDEVF